MSKKVVSFVGIIALAFCGVLGYYLLVVGNDNSDAKKFSKEYTKVETENAFVYRNANEIIRILENGTGVVFLGFPECAWCQAYAPYLNEVALDLGIEKIFYCNIREDRQKNTEAYQKIVALIGDYLLYDDEGSHRVYVPDVTIVMNGTIIGHNNETSTATTENDGTPEEYWTIDKVKALKEVLEEMMEPLINEDCSDCEV